MRQFDDQSSELSPRESWRDSSTVPASDLGQAARRAQQRKNPELVSATEVETAISGAANYLYALQHADGHWCGELEGCTILESEYMFLLQFLGRREEPRFQRAAEHVRRQQRPEGGWSIYPGGPADVSTSVKAYFALKLSGDGADMPHMIRARKTILDLGGIEAVNSFTKIYLSIFGQYEWERCPAIPPEMILLPRWFYFNIYEMSSWSRVMVVPLSILWAQKPLHHVPRHAELGELRGRGSIPRATPRARSREEIFWGRLFHTLDRGLKVAERAGSRSLRAYALERAEEWILRRMEISDGVGAIFPPIINTVFALSALGYSSDHPTIAAQMRELERLELGDECALRVQPCFGPVWDTALAVRALTEMAEAPDDLRIWRAGRWLLGKEVRHAGDWRIKSPKACVGGWFFQYENAFNPDCDDTAQVLIALSRVRFGDPGDRDLSRAARRRGLNWLLAMQNEDGGFGAFDKDCTKRVLTYVPFADHNAMIDPSCADITGRVLEALATSGVEASHAVVRRAVRYLRRTQGSDGTWYGRWGCNYVYGTWLALQGLARSGEDMRQHVYTRAADWLRASQQSDGGWGESLASYEHPSSKGAGQATAAQTAWALLGLFAVGDFDSEAVRRGVAYLLRARKANGTWEDAAWTGTGFPKVFYLRYHLYDKYFPLLALASYLEGRRSPRSYAARQIG